MKTLKIVLALFSVLVGCTPAFAQSRRIMGGSAGSSRYQFFYDSFLDPAMPEVESVGGGTIGGEGTIHRFMSDRRQRVYFGYDLTIEVLPDPGMFRITFG